MSYLKENVKVHYKTGNKKVTLKHIKFLICVLVIPILISFIVYTRHSPLPGAPGEWFGFMGSYIGSVASVAIALLTMDNSKKLDDMNLLLLNSAIGFNVRFVDFIIYPVAEIFPSDKLPPCYIENEKKDIKFNQYKVVLKFVSKNNIAVNDFVVNRVKLKVSEDKEVIFEPFRSHKEQGEFPSKMYASKDSLDVYFKIGVESGTEAERKLSKFYFYFSQFSEEYEKIDISFDMTFCLEHNRFVAEGDRKSSNFEKEKEIKVYKITLDAECQMLPKFNEKPFYNKAQINKYEIRPANFDREKFPRIDTDVNKKRNGLKYHSKHIFKLKNDRFHYKKVQKWEGFGLYGGNDCLENTEMKLELEKK